MIFSVNLLPFIGGVFLGNFGDSDHRAPAPHGRRGPVLGVEWKRGDGGERRKARSPPLPHHGGFRTGEPAPLVCIIGRIDQPAIAELRMIPDARPSWSVAMNWAKTLFPTATRNGRAID